MNVNLRYLNSDLTSGERRTLKELGTARGVTRERIRQIEAAAKNKWGGLVRAPQPPRISRISDEPIGAADDLRATTSASARTAAVAFQLLVAAERKGWSPSVSDQEPPPQSDRWRQLSSLLSKHDIAQTWRGGATFADLRFIAPGALPKRWTLDDLEPRRRGEPASVKQLLAEAELRRGRVPASRCPRPPRTTANSLIDWGRRRGLDGRHRSRRGVSMWRVHRRRGRGPPKSLLAAAMTTRGESSVLLAWRALALRMPVTDLLRGSGRSIPVQFAAYLGCRPGVNKVFAVPRMGDSDLH